MIFSHDKYFVKLHTYTLGCFIKLVYCTGQYVVRTKKSYIFTCPNYAIPFFIETREFFKKLNLNMCFYN